MTYEEEQDVWDAHEQAKRNYHQAQLQLQDWARRFVGAEIKFNESLRWVEEFLKTVDKS